MNGLYVVISHGLPRYFAVFVEDDMPAQSGNGAAAVREKLGSAQF
jgi:hypothetical protein